MEYNIEYLKILSEQYPDIKSACTEIIRLQSFFKR